MGARPRNAAAKLAVRKRSERTTQGAVPRPLAVVLFTVGSICSGLNVEKMALSFLLGRGYALVEESFACDCSPHAKAFATANFPHLRHFFDDCSSKEFHANAPAVDILCAGFPCQPFSTASKCLGEADPRGKVVNHILRYICKHRPRVAILENVVGLMQRHPQTILRIFKVLSAVRDARGQPFYRVGFKVLNSFTHGGVPQNRPRCYMLAVRTANAKLTWPSMLPTKPTLSAPVPCLGLVLARAASESAVTLPSAAKAKEKVMEALHSIQTAGYDAQAMAIAINANAITMKWYIDRVPCLTASRAREGGFWVTNLGRFLTLSEMFRLQGINPAGLQLDGIPRGRVGDMIGNAFTQTIFERLFIEVLPAADLVPAHALRRRFAN